MEGPRHLRILFLTDHYCDYLSDPLYIGLSRVLGNEQVMEYPYKAAYHEPRVRYWFMAQRPGKNYSREEITDLLRDGYFDLVCLASSQKECLDECAQLYELVRFPPMVFVDGWDGIRIRHDVVERYPISVYFKLDYVWNRGNWLRNLGALAWTFRANRRLFARTVPLPLSIVLDSLPDVGPVSKEIDVSFRGRASHPRRPMAVQILSRMRGVNFAGGVYAGPEDRKYKLKAGVLARFRAKVFDNTFAGEADQRKYRSPEDYYREIAASKIAVALRGGAETPTFRYFEIAAFRTMLIADPPETGIPNDFVDRQHAVYCKRDLSDLEKLVHHYLREDAEREAITSAGYDHLVKYHTCERRAEYFLETCRRLV